MKNLKETAWEILADRYKGMQALDMEDSGLDVQKEDFIAQLKAKSPGATNDDVAALLGQLAADGDIKLATNDVITFYKSFIR